MAYKNAWKCHKCPENAGANGCPAWTEYVETDKQTGEERITKECVFQALPKLLVYTMASANQAAATMDQHRNEMTNAVSQAAAMIVAGLPEALVNAQDGGKALLLGTGEGSEGA